MTHRTALSRLAMRSSALAVTCTMCWLAPAVTQAEEISLAESGSSLLYPLFNIWVTEYAKVHPGVRISAASTGSGVGIDQAVAGSVQIGTSDAYMSDEQIERYSQIINVPMAIAAQTVNYNLPGLNSTRLRLDGPTLAGIYTGKVHAWDDKAIAILNPGVMLPHHDIIPVHRVDGSGDTFVFTQYLTFSTPSWEDTLGFGTSIAWPTVTGGLSAEGNAGVLQVVQQTPFSISYLGVSFHADIAKAGLGTALLKSYSGEFLEPTPETIAAAAASLGPRTPADERLTLVNAPGANAYPLVNYEYAIVSTKQINVATADALRKFLLWAIAPDEANEKYLSDSHFIALPAHIWVLSHDQIELIKSK
jgi:phosphate transport system substrate-binding protein